MAELDAFRETIVTKEACPDCGYVMTKPFENHCPMHIKRQTEAGLPQGKVPMPALRCSKKFD